MKKITNVICLTLLCIQMVLLFTCYSKLSDKIGIHFNVNGEVDNYGPKWMLFLILIISMMLFALFNYIRKKPEKFNYPFFNEDKKDSIYKNSQSLIDYLSISTLLILTYVMLLFTVYNDKDISNLIIVLYVLILFPIGFIIFYMRNLYKISNNKEK